MAGQTLHEMARQWLASGPDLSRLPLTAAIIKATEPMEADDPGIGARTLAGIILGFPPTLFGNLVTALGALAANKKLWALQLMWQAGPLPPLPAPRQQLRAAIEQTLVFRPVPAMVWRVARQHTTLHGVPINAGDTIVAGLVSATHDGADHFTAFGGRRPATSAPGQPSPLHACPGYAMSMGVLQGVLAAVLELGSLRPSPSPVVLSLQLEP